MSHTNNGLRPKVVAVTAFTVCLLALLVWYSQRGSNPTQGESFSNEPTPANQPQQPGSLPKAGSRSRTNLAREAKHQLPQPPGNVVLTDKTAAVQRQIEASVDAMNGAIAFWGCVVDQNGNPIAGAKVSLSCRTWQAQPLDANASQTKTELATDEAGRFQIGGMTGDRLTIDDVVKPGYLLSPRAKKTFAFANSPKPFFADPNVPEIIRMWKQGQHEPTVSQEGFYGFQPDGRAYVVDLLTGKSVEGNAEQGDLRVRITRPAKIKPREKYPWVLEIAAVDGGLVEAGDDYLYQAPEAGYLSAVKIVMNPEQAGWTSVLKKAYYLKSRGGKVYGAIQMTVRPNYGNGSSMQTESVLNSNGSRNLEP